jgi:hypothetical protein
MLRDRGWKVWIQGRGEGEVLDLLEATAYYLHISGFDCWGYRFWDAVQGRSSVYVRRGHALELRTVRKGNQWWLVVVRRHLADVRQWVKQQT